MDANRSEKGSGFKISPKYEAEIKSTLPKLQVHGCTYLSYIIINENDTHRFASDEKWLFDSYLRESLSMHCPIKKMAFSGQFQIIPWNRLTLNKKEAEVMLARYDNGMRHGITFVNQFHNLIEIVAIATEDKSFNLSNDFFNSPAVYKKNLLNIRRIGVNYLLEWDVFSGAKSLERPISNCLDRSMVEHRS